jgi:putative transposase
MAKVLGVSRSGYYQFIRRPPSKRAQENERLLKEIKVIHQESRATYGSPRIHDQLQKQGELCSRKRIARLMKQEGIEAKMKKRFRKTTQVDSLAKKAPNLLLQDFTADKPNQRWVSDITYIHTSEGWLYVAAILDLFSRRIVGLSMGERLTTELVRKALYQAITHRKPASGLLYHSDKGCQYTSYAFQEDLALNNMRCSMSGTGNCYDNAAMESFFHTLKTEHVYFESYKTREQAKKSIFEYVEVFYNRKRSHSTLGYLAPEIFENQWQQKQNLSLPSVH